MTWQIAYSHRMELRRNLLDAGIDGQHLVRLAISNLMKFAVVGIQTDIAGLADAIWSRYGVRLSIGRINVTDTRLAKSDIAPRTLKTSNDGSSSITSFIGHGSRCEPTAFTRTRHYRVTILDPIYAARALSQLPLIPASRLRSRTDTTLKGAPRPCLEFRVTFARKHPACC